MSQSSQFHTGLAPASWSLDVLNTQISTLEQALGPLVKIGNDASQTLLTFDLRGGKPAKTAQIVTKADGVPAGMAQLPGVTGKVFIANVLTDAIVVRPN